jgi:uracil-DNA glycosylase family 4
MRWSERQRAMLLEMGVRMWEREAAPSGLADGAVEIEEAHAEEARPDAAVWAAPSPALPSAPTGVEWQPADWLIVGEPFDAAAGAATAAADQARLLAHMLQAIHVSRDASTREARACHFALAESTRPQLDAALEGVRPRLIVALGRAAAEVLLDVDEPLGRLRGKVHQRAGVRVVVSFPLAYLLRNPSEKAKAWADLCLAVRSLEGDAGASVQ